MFYTNEPCFVFQPLGTFSTAKVSQTAYLLRANNQDGTFTRQCSTKENSDSDVGKSKPKQGKSENTGPNFQNVARVLDGEEVVLQRSKPKDQNLKSKSAKVPSEVRNRRPKHSQDKVESNERKQEHGEKTARFDSKSAETSKQMKEFIAHLSCAKSESDVMAMMADFSKDKTLTKTQQQDLILACLKELKTITDEKTLASSASFKELKDYIEHAIGISNTADKLLFELLNILLKVSEACEIHRVHPNTTGMLA